MKADISIRSIDDAKWKTQWDSFATHPLQSWAWGEFRRAMGVDTARLGIFKHDKLIDGWQITFHRIPHTPFTIGYFPKGPLPTREMIVELTLLGKQKNAIAIQLEPNIPLPTHYPPSTSLGTSLPPSPLLRPAHHPLFTRYTFVLDLTKSDNELLSAMHSKTRYNIRVAQKHGVVIAQDNSDNAFDTYLRLSKETTLRQGFYAHNERYHTEMWRILKDARIAHLFTASYQQHILAAWIVFVWHNTLYYPYGASSRNNRETMAPNLLLWEIAKWAKKQGLTSFDLWGAIGPNPDPHDPWYGFHRFKEGYRPNLVEFIGSYDLVIKPVLYQLYTIADYARWFFLRIKSTFS
ncbi:hypothetical protein A2Z00_01060 [Candidatus Gottesmanbacteria bacterium RBG_13_45_10]|uniref:BioF2-like acetyltransferase domain-containing protein n=1 Tax=Candidatus Gottesmanbacteria bacterium RBG_13_45_10 TaxID=1798370 RepID=A0A1F5ZH53_9BACT|nr:MAG: hypothetical protein A2Z00_01060 [Candidatus Gottesmanbacteria bacterium RBG_13_45_10]